MYSSTSSIHGGPLEEISRNLILSAIYEAMNERPRRSGMKRECAKTGAIQRHEIRMRSFGNLPDTVLKPFSEMKGLDPGSTSDFHD